MILNNVSLIRSADYRVLPALIADLDDAYGELAELNEQILRACGAGIVPFLKEGFSLFLQ